MRLTQVAMRFVIPIMLASLAGASSAAEPLPPNPQLPLFHGRMPPGAIAATRQMMAMPQHPGIMPAGPYFQPVRFEGPDGLQFSLAQMGQFGEPQSELMAGLMVGQVYRFKITGLPSAEGAELFPTIEMVDRTYPPPGLATSYPIQVAIDEIDIASALDGQMVTRVIYLEDPQTAVPLRQPASGPVPIDVGESEDPLHMADRLGRVVAIVRIGSLAPPRARSLMPTFLFGSPPWAPIFKPESTSSTASESVHVHR
ncbi:MAG: hypothetical protein AAGC97_00385 [Planctomycetota bacterium]